ncbi:MAG TPA: shikimate kinase [Methylomirabilota bacterium]|jgi:shikimate kinase
MTAAMTAVPHNVILVGFMGAGKSTVGRLLARRLGRCFVETDAMITAGEGRSIPEIFADRGEPHFRQLERQVLEALSDKQSHVVATGGGFPCEPGVMDRLLTLGTVVWLAADFEAAYARANRVGGRPMLAGRSAEDAAALYRARQEFYRRAHLALDTTRMTVDAVVGRIVRHVRERERNARPTAAPAEDRSPRDLPTGAGERRNV